MNRSNHGVKSTPPASPRIRAQNEMAGFTCFSLLAPPLTALLYMLKDQPPAEQVPPLAAWIIVFGYAASPIAHRLWRSPTGDAAPWGVRMFVLLAINVVLWLVFRTGLDFWIATLGLTALQLAGVRVLYLRHPDSMK